MIETLNSLDTALLLWLNGFHTGLMDGVMFLYSQKFVWVLLYASLIYYSVLRYGWRGLWVVLAVVAAVGLADFISSGIIKHLVCRPRPSRVEALNDTLHVVNNYRGGRYGFVSSHAANCFSLCTVFALFTRDRLIALTLLLWAAVNAYSRIYLGVHYPGDILGGLLVGVGVAFLIHWAYGLLARCWEPLRLRERPLPPTTRWMVPLCWVLTCGAFFVVA